jgi:2-(1,2-epoxy-1,2-dihydrophenyl)acetyl-CoA isomerase
MSARDVKADEAEGIGLASRVLPAGNFGERVAEYAKQIAAGPPIGLALAKRLLVNSLDTELLTQLRREVSSIYQCLATEDSAEAMRAFVEKRRPVFKGR